MSGDQQMLLDDLSSGESSASAESSLPNERAPHNRVFAEALLEQSTTRQRRSPRDWALSFFIHLAILFALLFVPLYFSQGLDLRHLETTLLVAPMPPMAAPPPPPAAVARAARITPKAFAPGVLTAPTFVPKAVPATSNDVVPPEESFSAGMGGVAGGVPGGQIGGIAGGMPNLAAPVPAAAPVAEGPKRPVRVGGEVKPPRLLYGPAAMYPILASQGHIHGTVVIDAIIDEHGNVVQEKVVSGHPLLVQAALKAVSERKYEPTILDGEPTPVDLRVEVNFQM